ncbi:hypothetical protein IT408_02035 [Candidatus Uhrbacteria bacterium]|nr:hypothetical protein [Candidatus Uhrbacteria bacterium]
MSARFVRLIPAIRTIHGVDFFDYSLPVNHDFSIGDIVRFYFRRRYIVGMIYEFLDDSPFKKKIQPLEKQIPLLRLGEPAKDLLQQTALRTLTSQPTVLLSWLRKIPKRAKGIETSSSKEMIKKTQSATSTNFVLDRWKGEQGLLAQLPASSGPILILTPWRHRTEQIAELCGALVLHADITDTKAWNVIQAFCEHKKTIVVSTRIGAWLGCVAQTILIDEPEHDDHKQDDASPRYDARWIATMAKTIRPEVTLTAFSTTPRLQHDPIHSDVPTIEPLPILDPLIQGHRSTQVPVLTESSIYELEQAILEHKPAVIVHPTEGLRGRISCRDCGWAAHCDDCDFLLSHTTRGAECRRCGKTTSIPDQCQKCGGFDLSRGRIGRDLLQTMCSKYFGENKIAIVSPTELESTPIHGGCVVVTDVQGFSGVVEDIRRKERLAINLRRLAAKCAVNQTKLIWQGKSDVLQECSAWLSAAGLHALWNTERKERSLFSYPPMTKLVKILIDGTEDEILKFKKKLKDTLGETWHIRGPFIILFRSKKRQHRQIIHLIPPLELSSMTIVQTLQPFASQAIFDLDPVSFFC